MVIDAKDESIAAWRTVSIGCNGVLYLVAALLGTTSTAMAGPKIITFDVPKASLTQPTSINDAGTVAGYFGHNAYVRGFLRAPDGTLTTIRIHGGNDELTEVQGLNNDGSVAGFNGYGPAVENARGFLRTSGGLFTLFRVAHNPVTVPTGINSIGTIAGYYKEAIDTDRLHGFVRTTDGSVITFDPSADVKWTFPLAINKKGVIVGGFEDADFVIHGFIRNADGKIITLDIPECPSASSARTISRSGWIGGVCDDFGDELGFVRASDGTTATFAASAAAEVTVVNGINDDGAATGYYQDQDGFHSFVREADGKITTFDVPGGHLTVAYAINATGVIAGSFRDSDEHQHGFIRTPGP